MTRPSAVPRSAIGSLLRPLALALLLATACTAATSDGSGPTGPTAIDGVGASLEPAPSISDSTSPSPAPERFLGRIRRLPPWLAARMTGTTWEPGCPVALEDLRLLSFDYHGLDGEIHRGPMVVNASVADDVLEVFRQLFRAGFPLGRVALARRWRPNASTDTTTNVTAAFNCRPSLDVDGSPSGSWSEHAYGLAVDVNPLQNPYVATDGAVLRPAAEPYVDRSQDRPGMIHVGDIVVRAFSAIGWTWGGDWSGAKDYMHFSLRGR